MKNYLYNYDLQVIMSKTGKSTKKGKSGRPKNSKSKDTIIKEIIKELPDDLLKEIVKDWIDKTNKSGDEKSNEILRKLSKVIGLSKHIFEELNQDDLLILKKSMFKNLIKRN